MDYKEEVKKRVDELYNDLSDNEKDEMYRKQRKNINFVCVGLFLFLAVLGLIYIVFGIPDPVMIGWGVFLIIFAIALVSVIQWKLRDKEKTIKLHLRSQAKNETSNKFVEIFLEKHVGEFKVDKDIRVYDVAHFRTVRLLIDTKNRQFIYVLGKKYSPVIHFKDILSYEVYEDGNSVVKGSAGRALIGGAFFGVIGALVGSSGKRRVSNYCSSLKLLIRVNDIDNPQIEISFINSQIDKNSFTYKTCIKSLQKITSYFEYMINNKTLEEPVFVEKSKSKREELLELKVLLEDGLITEEDYNKKKENILK